MPKNGHFPEKCQKTGFLAVWAHKRPFWAFLALLAQGFYINPSGGGPGGLGSPRGLPGPCPGGSRDPVPGIPGIQDPRIPLPRG